MVVRFAEATYAPFLSNHVEHMTEHDHPDPVPSTSTQNDIAEPPPKRQKLFANYEHTREHHSDNAIDVSVAELLARYLRDSDGDCDSEPVDFWVRNKATYDKLIPAVRRTFAIPASSAPVERVFSHGGIVLRPNRARMSDKLLSELVFLKCNIV